MEHKRGYLRIIPSSFICGLSRLSRRKGCNSPSQPLEPRHSIMGRTARAGPSRISRTAPEARAAEPRAAEEELEILKAMVCLIDLRQSLHQRIEVFQPCVLDNHASPPVSILNLHAHS